MPSTFNASILNITNAANEGYEMSLGHTDTHIWYTDVYLHGKVYRHWGRKHHEKAIKHLELLRRIDKESKIKH